MDMCYAPSALVFQETTGRGGRETFHKVVFRPGQQTRIHFAENKKTYIEHGPMTYSFLFCLLEFPGNNVKH